MSGVYWIKNVQTGEVYIGASKRIRGRWNAHRSLLRNNVHHCRLLQEDWNKFGEQRFEFVVHAQGILGSHTISSEGKEKRNQVARITALIHKPWKHVYKNKTRKEVWTPERRARKSKEVRERARVIKNLWKEFFK